MRKSAAVRLTLVPMLAASALAHAQAPGETPPAAESSDIGRPLPFEWSNGAPDGIDWTLSPPGLTPPRVIPPCDEDPYAPYRDDCQDETIHAGHGGGMHGAMIIRGGFGGHFGGHGG